jgi:hypothetical protein
VRSLDIAEEARVEAAHALLEQAADPRIHAFAEHYRYEKKEVGLLVAFWNDNDGDVLRVKKSLKYLIYGGSEFEERLHDVLYGGLKLRGIGPSSALELYGTLKPEECPPINGATAKALRYLGFNVQAI